MLRCAIAIAVLWTPLMVINDIKPIFFDNVNAFDTSETTHLLELFENEEFPNKMLISGVIEYDDIKDIIREIELGNYDTIVLNSPGGNLSAGVILGREFRKRNISTVIPSGAVCTSTCAYAFMGGTRRTVELGGRYGLHRPFIMITDEIKDSNPLKVWNDGMLTGVYVSSYLLEMGMKGELAVLHLVHKEMKYFTIDELKKYNITT